MTLCCRRCLCCSVFTFCGSIQSFAGLLFVLGLVAFPAGWGSDIVRKVREEIRENNLLDCSIDPHC